MKVQNLLFLVLIAGLVTPAAYAQNAGFAVGVQRPIINPLVAPMTHPPVMPMGQPPVQGRIPHFGVTPHIVPPIVSTFPPSQFPTQFPGHQFPNGQTWSGRIAVDPVSVIRVTVALMVEMAERRMAVMVDVAVAAVGLATDALWWNVRIGLWRRLWTNHCGPANGTVVTNSSVVIIQQPQGQVVRVGPSTPPVTVTGNGANYQESLVGMTRDQVIQQFGTPISGVYSQSGEMLAFSGGMTIVIQNGKVVRPN